MKQITIDYETYIKELEQSRLDGFNLVENFLKMARRYIKAIEGYDKKEYEESKYKLLMLLDSVEKIKNAKS